MKRQSGGSALNTCKILRLLGETDVTFCGAIGDDDVGRILIDILNDLEIKSFLQTIDTQQTGAAICLISGQNRCCVANIGASKHFHLNELSLQHLTSHPKIFYVEGYFVPGRFDVCRHIVKKFCQQSDGPQFAFNLSAPYIVTENADDVKYLCESADMLFGNLSEFEALANVYGLKTVESVALKLLELEKSCRFIVVTNNEKAVQIFVRDCDTIEKFEHQIKSIPDERIVDTTGAGDSFVAGFFFKYLRGFTISSCVKFGSETAARKITMIGANLPEASIVD